MVILASASPQRKTLLRQIGIEPLVVPTDIDENLDNEDIISSLEKLAEDKVAAALEKVNSSEPTISTNNCWIVGADTVILLDGAVFGKPQDSGDAGRMLKALSGRTHQVATGVCARKIEKPDAGKLSSERADSGGAFSIVSQEKDVSVTTVTFRPLSQEETSWYVATGEWHNAAGAYRIQGKGACLVASINGSFSNVVGLPLELIYGILVKLGYVF